METSIGKGEWTSIGICPLYSISKSFVRKKLIYLFLIIVITLQCFNVIHQTPILFEPVFGVIPPFCP